ncbi:hypothetical protein CVT25_008569 [Psilocybe cyanescens]|uniref:DUF6699 domain-containing protein n=1 Tax=Psilocybe cyanescens TaxID=93625 RepID=A0A409XNH6_PSICY|nr:hypothetical protein CVT25_008569 [Psilocybe cyanescens]
MADFTTHALLSYSQHPDASDQPQPTIWDIREPSQYARYPSKPEHPLSDYDLSQPATNPPTSTLHIVCEFFPGYWPIKIRRPNGVTVGDVLEEIHSTLIRRISLSEWEALSEKQQGKITAVFEHRCDRAPDRAVCRSHGVIRMDCLLEHTWFAGLSVSFEMDTTCIMTLRRERQKP